MVVAVSMLCNMERAAAEEIIVQMSKGVYVEKNRIVQELKVRNTISQTLNI